MRAPPFGSTRLEAVLHVDELITLDAGPWRQDTATMLRSWRMDPPVEPPVRQSLSEIQRANLLALVAQEYSAVRNDVQVALGSQVSSLSAGAATVGLLASAAGLLYARASWLAVVILTVVIPIVCFLALTVYANEQVRQMRAGFFLKRLEDFVNSSANGNVLVFEHWDVRSGRRDVDRYNRRAIIGIFSVIAIGFTIAGYAQLFTIMAPRVFFVVPLISANVLALLAAGMWIRHLCTLAVSYRAHYFLCATNGARSPGRAPPMMW